MSIKIVGNCSNLINWSKVVENLELKKPGIQKKGHPSNWVTKSVLDPNFPEFESVKKYLEETSSRLEDANYNFAATLWYVYRQNEHFDKELVELVCDFLNVVPLMVNAYRVDPGCNCPFHVDPQLQVTKNKVRYTWQISPSSPGQILLVGNEALHNLNIGDIYQWDDHQAPHGATNCSFLPVYYFLVEGIKK